MPFPPAPIGPDNPLIKAVMAAGAGTEDDDAELGRLYLDLGLAQREISMLGPIALRARAHMEMSQRLMMWGSGHRPGSASQQETDALYFEYVPVAPSGGSEGGDVLAALLLTIAAVMGGGGPMGEA
jgi:hypothetical protein